MTPRAPRPARPGLWLPVLWMAVIFATSCTVVLPRQFFRFMRSQVLRDAEVADRFEIFWGLAWFAIVKSWHATEFALLFLLCFWVLGRRRPLRRSSNVLIAILIAIAFAATDEWHQTFVPGRGGTGYDVLIDSAGVLAAAFVVLRRTKDEGRGTNKGERGISKHLRESLPIDDFALPCEGLPERAWSSFGSETRR